MYTIDTLLAIMRQLRDPNGGCPWDRQQNFRTIAPYTIEEAYEVADAIERGDLPHLQDELGDLLFQVVFHAQMAAEVDAFNFQDVVKAICGKMIRRHPHVFGEASERDAETQTHSWEAMKAEERQRQAGTGELSALDGVGVAMPALSRSMKLQRRAARVGFDWDSVNGILDKIREELVEVEQELHVDAPLEKVEAEIGDLLFACSNLARFLKIDPESAMRHANSKFERRFREMERALRVRGKKLEDSDIHEMEAEWQAVKRREAEG
jgi:MazG family protein